jgi:hypothetical protein
MIQEAPPSGVAHNLRSSQGLNGIFVSFAFPCKARKIAFAIAALGPTIPLSPIPFTPNGFSGVGESWCTSVKLGVSIDVGRE